MGYRWLVEEDGNEEDGYIWNVMIRDDLKLRCYAQCFSESDAERIRSAMVNLDAWEGCMGTLAMEGIAIDAKTGLVWERPKSLKSYDVKIEKSLKSPTKPSSRKP